MQGMNSKNFDEVFGLLIAQGISADELFDAVCKQVNFLTSCPPFDYALHYGLPQASQTQLDKECA